MGVARADGGAVRGPDDQQLVDLFHGEHYLDTLRGRVFSIATTPLGIAIPIYTATDLLGVPVLINLPSSGVNVELLEYSAAWASGTSAFSAIGLMIRPYTTTTLSAYVAATPFNGNFGGGVASKIAVNNAGQATASAGVAGDFARAIGTMNLEASSATYTPAHQALTLQPKGSIILPPGTMCYVAGTKASVALFAQHFVWKEIPRIN